MKRKKNRDRPRPEISYTTEEKVIERRNNMHNGDSWKGEQDIELNGSGYRDRNGGTRGTNLLWSKGTAPEQWE